MAKKKAEKIGEIKKNPKRSKRYERQLKWIFIGMGVLVLIVLIVYFGIESTKRFDYGGIKFQKIKYDKLLLYYSKIPISDSSGNLKFYYNLYLRNDPRNVNIPVNGEIQLSKETILSVDESINGCEDNGIAGMTLGTFFQAAGINKVSGSTNETIAKERDLLYATCENTNSSIIVLKQGNETFIREERPDCYVIQFKDCEVLKAVERFIVAAIANSQGITISR